MPRNGHRLPVPLLITYLWASRICALRDLQSVHSLLPDLMLIFHKRVQSRLIETVTILKEIHVAYIFVDIKAVLRCLNIVSKGFFSFEIIDSLCFFMCQLKLGEPLLNGKDILAGVSDARLLIEYTAIDDLLVTRLIADLKVHLSQGI
jgi:hypothetical protein